MVPDSTHYVGGVSAGTKPAPLVRADLIGRGEYGPSYVDEPVWQRDAACKGQSVELFFGPDHEEPDKWRKRRERVAKGFCGTCSVRGSCLEAGMTEEFGIWGGLTPRERRQVRRAK